MVELTCMTISRKNILIASVAAVCAAAIVGGGCTALSAQAKALDASSASLFLPASYEQYLKMNDPKDLTISEGFIAIADGNRIYLCDREKQEWRTYTNGADHATFGKIQLVGDLLYFTDAAMRLHSLDPQAADFGVKELPYSLANFIIAGGSIYGTTTMNMTTSLYALSMDGTTSIPDTKPVVDNLPAQLPMAYADGILYYAVSNAIFPIDTKTNEMDICISLSSSSVINPRSIACLDGFVYYTETTGFYRANIQNSEEAHTPEKVCLGEGFSALTVFNEKIYVLQDDAVREFDPAENAFTGYEIAADSSSSNRLSGAVDSARGGTLLVTADKGNNRVSVYDFATKKYTEIYGGDGFSPTHVATDGTIIAAVSQNTIYTCTYSSAGDMQFTAAEDDIENNIRGIACVYGAVYYVTGNAYGKLGEKAVFHDGCGSPDALASDVYGDLLVVYMDGSIARFTEGEFLDKDVAVEKLDYTLPEGFKSLRADFEGNLYYLLGSTLYRGGNEEIATVRGSDYVYTMSEGDPFAFALGYEDDEVYFLFGDYIVRSAAGALDIPTLSEIDCGGVYENVFAPHGTEGLFVEIPAHTVGIRTDLTPLREEKPACFPYEFYFRTEEDARGILLAEKDGFALVVLYEIGENTRDFTASLFRIDPEQDDLLVAESDYWTESSAVRYLTSNVSAYFFPCLPPALADAQLLRGARVNVLGTVQTPFGSDFALIEYETSAHSLARGYVPVSYLCDVDPDHPAEEEFLFATLKKAGENGYTFAAEDGEILTLHGGERVRLQRNEDGSYIARYTAENGKIYSATLPADRLDFGESDALRISLIVILSVLAVLIVGLYIWFLPKKPKNRNN